MTRQEEFDSNYITSEEFRKILNYTKVKMHLEIKKGRIPNPIRIGANQMFIWHRDDVGGLIE
jgi:predicted DNA-binding transcriptional regulator AlpA